MPSYNKPKVTIKVQVQKTKQPNKPNYHITTYVLSNHKTLVKQEIHITHICPIIAISKR